MNRQIQVGISSSSNTFPSRKSLIRCAVLIKRMLATIGVKRDELAAKLRQPLGELVGDKKLHTVGEKRLMKYHVGAKQ